MILTQQSQIVCLECSQCGTAYSAYQPQTFSECCNQPLSAKYNTNFPFSKESLIGRRNDMWRYLEMLPVLEEQHIVSLGEGMTPILHLKKLGEKYGMPNLLLKDEGLNPTGSFKARGLSMAVSKAKEFGATTCIIPTAGNAGGAMSAYCAAAGMHAIVVMPRHTPDAFKEECRLFGAELILVDGLINDCAKEVARLKKDKDYFDMSTLKEPYRLEGKKTMGYEIAEQLNWQLPDVILYPTGGGTGLIGIWKAFTEMIQLKWIKSRLPRMIAVQAEHCKPVWEVWSGNIPNAKGYKAKPSLANGLAVPEPFAMNMIQDVLHKSGGLPATVSEEAIVQGVHEMARHEGLLVAPEGGAIWKALLQLTEQKIIRKDEKILLLNTGSCYKYMENIR
ncbi:MAG TPA: threonine synthase [Chitinophagaceae bacterium]|nr:threonine synthase [Chitinophagaceae bacterium]